MRWVVALLPLTQLIGVVGAKELPCAPGRFVSMCKVAGSCPTNTGGARWSFTLRDDGRVCPVFVDPPEQLVGCKTHCGKLRQKRDGALRVRWRKHCSYARGNLTSTTTRKYRGVLASDCSSISGKIIDSCTCDGPRCAGQCDVREVYPVAVTRGFCGDGIVDEGGYGPPGPETCEPGVLLSYVDEDFRITPRECEDPALACRPDCTCSVPQ